MHNIYQKIQEQVCILHKTGRDSRRVMALALQSKGFGCDSRPSISSHPSPALPDDYTKFTLALNYLIIEVIVGGKTGKT